MIEETEAEVEAFTDELSDEALDRTEEASSFRYSHSAAPCLAS